METADHEQARLLFEGSVVKIKYILINYSIVQSTIMNK